MNPHLARGVLILDYGSQYTLLIARRIREQDVYCEIWPCTDPRLDEIIARGEAPARALILSGGPDSVEIEGSPALQGGVLDLDMPVLGICYGMQLLGHAFGAEITPDAHREYGRTQVHVDAPGRLLGSLPAESTVWMSHSDVVAAPPDLFRALARSENNALAAMEHTERPIFAVQFHPEVVHTDHGVDILRAFLFDVAGCQPDWTPGDIIAESVATIREQVGEGHVICGLSGGVDSSVVAALLAKAIPCLLYTSPSPRDRTRSRMPSSA